MVRQIEAGEENGPEPRLILEKALQPMLERNNDTVVLGCTHYPFVIPLIQEIAGPQVRVIDPAPAVARQAQHLLERDGLLNPGSRPGAVQIYTTGDAQKLAGQLPFLLPGAAGDEVTVGQAVWSESGLAP